MSKKYDQEYRKRKSAGSGGHWVWRFIKFFITPPGLFLTLLAAAAGIIYWDWGRGPRDSIIRGFASNIWVNFEWGLLLLTIAVMVLIWIIVSRKVIAAIRHGNYVLGAIVFSLAAWGIQAFMGLGGIIGNRIAAADFTSKMGVDNIPPANFMNVLRVTGLFVLGFVLVAPELSFRIVKGSARWIINRLRRLSKLKPMPTPWPTQETLKTPQTLKTPVAGRLVDKLATKKKTPVPAPPAPSTPQQLKEVAQDVWKKYGEAPGGIEVDGWKLPPIEILDTAPEITFSQADNEQRARLIEEALGSYGVEAKVVQINAGPTVTQFGIEPGWDRRTKEVKVTEKDGKIVTKSEEISRTRVKVDRITSLANDLSLALAASSIRIEAPVPGKSIVGVEVPNTTAAVVSLRGVIETNAFQKVQAKSRLAIALGKGAGGEAVAADLARMPHLLIAGSTGSGKTVCLNAIITCLMLTNTPNDVRFIMIDPKRVELTTYNGIPHLALPVIVEAQKAVFALRQLAQEMNKRYQILAADGSRNIDGYNKNRQGKERMPFLVLIIDELADLMMEAGDEVEQTLCRLAQLARAVGIHLVVATQRPSVDVITGLIKANFPTRISFAVTSQVDSRTILDMVGAEKLLGSGDMLYAPTEAAKPKRLQGCYVSDTEAERLVYFWGNQHQGEVPPLFKIDGAAAAIGSSGRGGLPEDALLQEARQLAVDHDGNISTSFLQRRLHIGYPRAARLFEQLQEEMGNQDDEEEADGLGEGEGRTG